MAPCAPDFKIQAASPGTQVVFHDEVDASFFASSYVPARPTAIVVSAQKVSKEFLEAWRTALPQQQEPNLTLVRRGTSLGSIDLAAAKELAIDVLATPGVNSPHVARFVIETLGMESPVADPSAAKAVVVGAGSVGRIVAQEMKALAGLTPIVVNRSPDSPSLDGALRGATHVAVCAATSGEPIITAEHVEALLAGARRRIKICSVSRPEAFSLEAILMVAQSQAQDATLRFDYGDMILAPTRDKVNREGVQANITWSSSAMSSVACKQDLDEAVLRALQ